MWQAWSSRRHGVHRSSLWDPPFLLTLIKICWTAVERSLHTESAGLSSPSLHSILYHEMADGHKKEKDLSLLSPFSSLLIKKRPFWRGKAWNATSDHKLLSNSAWNGSRRGGLLNEKCSLSHSDQLCACVIQVWITDSKIMNNYNPRSVKW